MALDQVRHTKEDALNEREFQLLLEGADELKAQDDIQARFILLVGGRLGLRRGEIAHMHEEWIDWRRNMIVIPRHDQCDKGRDGGICGSCKQQAKQRVEYNDDLTLARATELQWSSKTDAAAREVPFDFDPRTSLVIERFFDLYDQYPYAAQSINRRVNKSMANSDLEGRHVYPHCLRATAASYHASRGLGTIPLQSLMGWAQLGTAQNYVTASGENTQRALNFTHS